MSKDLIVTHGSKYESYRTVKEYLVSVQNGDFKFGNEWFDDTEIEIAKN